MISPFNEAINESSKVPLWGASTGGLPAVARSKTSHDNLQRPHWRRRCPGQKKIGWIYGFWSFFIVYIYIPYGPFNIAMEAMAHRYSWFTYEKWWFSMAMYIINSGGTLQIVTIWYINGTLLIKQPFGVY